MSLPIATSKLAEHLISLQTMLSLSKEFQKQTNTKTANDAEKFTHFVSINPADYPRPNAIIWIENFEYVFISGGRLDDLGPGGVAGIHLTMDSDPLLKFGESHAAIEAANFFGGVMGDMVALSGDNVNLSFNSVDTQGPFRTPIEDRNSVGDFYYGRIMFDFKFNV